MISTTVIFVIPPRPLSHQQRADAAVVVKREARKEAQEAREDEAEAEKDLERMYTMQDGERHRFEYLVRGRRGEERTGFNDSISKFPIKFRRAALAVDGGWRTGPLERACGSGRTSYVWYERTTAARALHYITH